MVKCLSVPSGVSWKEAEDALLGAVEYLAALPGERWSTWFGSSWPAVLRIEQSDYPNRPSLRLRVGRREIAHVERMLLADDAVIRAIDPVARPLVAEVLCAKLWPESGFCWADVRGWLAGRGYGRMFGHGRVPSEEALRKRYSRAVQAVAMRLSRDALASG